MLSLLFLYLAYRANGDPVYALTLIAVAGVFALLKIADRVGDLERAIKSLKDD